MHDTISTDIKREREKTPKRETYTSINKCKITPMQAGSYKRERICMQEGVQSVKCLAIFKDRSAKIIVGILYQPDCTDSEENPEFGEET